MSTATVTPSARETTQEKYLRQIRNAVVIIAIIAVAAAVLTIWGVVQLDHIYNVLNTITPGSGTGL
ncbi:MAG TPA: hypothetical protein VNO25_20080 [Streptosporangiaceae bacterium]|jgi:hypothetical protein|nr:hypothetical protein [Streptosporangiaceae bacterium]